jgi:secreted trypsin-like serine protease
MKLFVLALALISTSAYAGFLTPPQAIIQGERVQPEEPITGSVLKLRMIGGNCTGTALSDKVVITAAHCPDLGGAVLAVGHLAGAQKECGIAEVEEVAYAPGAAVNEKGSHIPDVALLKLKTPLCGITPAKLRADATRTGETILAAGYGKGTITQDRPDRVALRTIAAKDIATIYADAVAQDPLMQEAVDYFTQVVSQYYEFALPVADKSSLCNGDSGGPVYQDINGETRLIGVNGAIASHPLKGTAECKYGYLQMYTPVAPYAPWIESKVAEWGK